VCVGPAQRKRRTTSLLSGFSSTHSHSPQRASSYVHRTHAFSLTYMYITISVKYICACNMCMHNAACEQEHTCDMCMCNACILYVK
jgi:hypothetical protein